MLIKMICFAVTKENLVRETDELLAALLLSRGWTRAYSTTRPTSWTMKGGEN